ncbi:NmrA family NAD(P)-binding protein [Candidatus Bathyarchaeota archaeon]|nr:NmrA family NAD(P)-binding protein [Candidatus Bathyarchaeota archaeon]
MDTIVVLGATGQQGGSVVESLLQNGNWKVRGVTRNVESEAAKKLAAKVCRGISEPRVLGDQ